MASRGQSLLETWHLVGTRYLGPGVCSGPGIN